MMAKGMVFVGTHEYMLVAAYCLGKSYLWNMFFGWRKTNKLNQAYYVLPRKVWKELAIIEHLIKT